MDKKLQCERSIIKKYRAEIWRKFTSALNEYQLIAPNDRIAVCVSGGKDSFLLAKCMQEVHKHGKFPFELKFICMNPGYNERNQKQINYNAELLGIPIEVFETPIFEIVEGIEDSPCYLCARMRRGYLYSKARELGCNKIALGHHMDDAIETVLMSMMYASEIKTMLPKLHSTNFSGMELIRPLYKVREEDIKAWVRYNDLEFIRCACRFTENIHTAPLETNSKRQEIKELIASLRKVNPNVDINVFRSMHNVNLDAMVGYRKGGEHHSFLDEYDKE